MYEILRDVISPYGAFREGDKGIQLKQVPKPIIEEWIKKGLIGKAKLPTLSSAS